MNSLPKTVTRQRRDCDLNPGPSAPESSTLTTRLPSHPGLTVYMPHSHCHTADTVLSRQVGRCVNLALTLVAGLQSTAEFRTLIAYNCPEVLTLYNYHHRHTPDHSIACP